MSELIQKSDNRVAIRWKLLAGVSVLALTARMASSEPARAEDADRPTVWIELGGQLSTLQDGVEAFNPPVTTVRPSNFDPSQKFEKQPRHSFDEFGAISIQPGGSTWALSASVQYGRAGANKHVQQQTNPEPMKYFASAPALGVPVAQRFAQTTVKTSEQHLVLDFMAGKDIGLGLFGKGEGTSVISAGVRYAQFSSRANISLKSDPDWQFHTKYLPSFQATISNGQMFHSNLASMTAERSFHGVGPSLSWKASETVAGNDRDASIALDWGVNAAILFGRQKSRTHHQSTARYFNLSSRPILTKTVVPHTLSGFPVKFDHRRTHSVTVPNIGAFAGLSVSYPNAKLSFGYRADFFFGAMDGGIDSRKTYDRSFYGPYATVSIGLGG